MFVVTKPPGLRKSRSSRTATAVPCSVVARPKYSGSAAASVGRSVTRTPVRQRTSKKNPSSGSYATARRARFRA